MSMDRLSEKESFLSHLFWNIDFNTVEPLITFFAVGLEWRLTRIKVTLQYLHRVDAFT